MIYFYLTILLSFAFSFGLIALYVLYSKRKHFSTLPDGPPDHFLKGNVKFAAINNVLEKMTENCRKFGTNGIMRFRYPYENPIIFLYKPDIVAEIFENHADKLNDRTMLTISLKEFTGFGKDIFMANGEYWKEARKTFVQGVMSSVVRSVPIIEKHLQKAVHSMKLKSAENPVQSVRDVLTFQTFSVIAEISAGRIPLSEQLVREFIDLTDKLNAYINPMNSRNQSFMIKHFPIQDEFRRLLARRDEILQQWIDQHRETLDPENPQDFLDSIIVDSESGDAKIPLSLIHVLLDTFLGGTDTSSSTIEFLIGYLANHPEVQKKIHEELDANVKGRYPTLDDEKNLPYLSAVLKETMRCSPVGGMLMRISGEEIKVRGYTIPKGTNFIVLNHAMLHDPEFWENPEEFRPDRFLEEEKEITFRSGEMPRNKEHLKFSLFGIGKRACAGFQLARKEIFLQAAYFLSEFEFSVPDPSKKIDLSMLFGLVTKPKHPVCVRTVARH